jgi:hypothetical protein
VDFDFLVLEGKVINIEKKIRAPIKSVFNSSFKILWSRVELPTLQPFIW